MFFFFQAEDGIRDLVRSRGLGDVYKRQNKNEAEVYRSTIHADLVRGKLGVQVKIEKTSLTLSLIHI